MIEHVIESNAIFLIVHPVLTRLESVLSHLA